MAYNLTDVYNSTNIPEVTLSVNQVSNTWLFVGLVAMIIIIALIVMVKEKYSFPGALFVSTLFGSIISVILVMTGGLAFRVASIIIGICMLALFSFLLSD